MQRVWRDYGAL